MKTVARIQFLPVILSLVVSAVWVQDGRGQEVRARVVAERSRSGMEGARVLLISADSIEIARTTTGPDGFFDLAGPGPGTFLIRIEHLGYGTVTRSVALEEGVRLIPAFVLSMTAIPLDTLEVEASRGAVAPPGVVGFSHPSYLLAGERMAELEKTGISFTSVVRELGGGFRLRGVMVGERNYTCIESSRRLPSFRGGGGSSDGCNMVVIIVDGVDTGLDGVAALQFVSYLRLYDYESVEYQTSVEAGSRYGLRASDRGALVLWSRGRGPHRSKARGGGR
jgi:hypothetical protein